MLEGFVFFVLLSVGLLLFYLSPWIFVFWFSSKTALKHPVYDNPERSFDNVSLFDRLCEIMRFRTKIPNMSSKRAPPRLRLPQRQRRIFAPVVYAQS